MVGSHHLSVPNAVSSFLKAALVLWLGAPAAAAAQQQFTPSPLPNAISAQAPANPTVPDPTALTTQALVRSLDTLKELIFARLQAMEQDSARIRERVMDEADRAKEDSARLQALTQQMFVTQGEKFANLQRQIDDGKQQLVQFGEETNVNLSAALDATTRVATVRNEANQAAISKAEASTIDRIRLIENAANSRDDSLRREIGALKERLDRAESRVETQTAQSGANRDSVGMWVGIGGTALAVFFGVMGILGRQQAPRERERERDAHYPHAPPPVVVQRAAAVTVPATAGPA
jgi:hypothetical protein